MSRSVLWDALSPIAARLAKPVREHEVMRITATINGKNPTQSAETARHEVLRWAQKRVGGALPGDAWVLQSFDYLSGGRNSIGIRIETDVSDIWALRADDPDKDVPGGVWTNEVIVGLMQNQLPRLSVRQLVSTSEDELNIVPAVPGFVQQVADRCGLSSGQYEIATKPWVIETEDEVQNLVDLLTDPARKLPVFVLTVPEDAADRQRPLLDPTSLARAIVGIGQVAVLPADLTWSLTNRLGRLRSVFSGAARAYLAGFSEDANPYAHRLILGEHLVGHSGSAPQGERWIRALAATEGIKRSTLGRDVLTFASIRQASYALNQTRLEKEGASESDRLAAASTRISDLEKQEEQTQAMLLYFHNEHSDAEERAETAEEQARASAFRIQQLTEELEALGGGAIVEQAPPSSWTDFCNWCDVQLAGRVVLSPQARRNLKTAEFEDVALAGRSLLWLASSCRNKRISGGEGSVGEEVIESGIRNAHCGSDQFDIMWQGQRYTADWHIKNGGNTRDPRRCMRIYYFWESNTQQIVVADMPNHRRTGAS